MSGNKAPQGFHRLCLVSVGKKTLDVWRFNDPFMRPWTPNSWERKSKHDEKKYSNVM